MVLLRYRLESYGVEVKLIRSHRLPEIWADPDQLKEVLANLLVNAVEVMVNGGIITIREEEGDTRVIFVEGQATSLYHLTDPGQEGVNQLTGDRIVLEFVGGELRRVQVTSDPGKCTGKYIPGGTSASGKAG